jgi:transcriptional regulator with XRE-family HTH domain
MAKELATLKKRLGSKIREKRGNLRMSQEELAFEAEITPTYVSQIEGGKRNPSLDVLFRLCTALQMELSELFKT